MDQERIPLDSSMRADDPDRDEARDDGTHEVWNDVAYKRLAIVNVAFIGQPSAGDRAWLLVDAGVTGMSINPIEHAADERFGKGNRPAAIILTHGHFDHIGGAKDLAERWDCPIYAHPLELPYLNGTSSYPPPDPSVGGGMMAWTSSLYPRGPIDVSERLAALPEDGSIPGFRDWRWIHVPGHTPGQIALWRASDRTLIAADAFVTTDQESIYAAITQKPELQGPPMYYTQDWIASRESVLKLAALEPETVITGHGRAMAGPEMLEKLRYLAEHFDQVAVPRDGKYVASPTRPEDGSAYAG